MGTTEAAAAVIVFETFGSKAVRRTKMLAKEDDSFACLNAVSEETAYAASVCEVRGNLVSKTVMPTFIQELLVLDTLAPFQQFSCSSSFPISAGFKIQTANYSNKN